MDSALVTALADLEEEQALAIVQQRLHAGDDSLALFEDTRRAMAIVGGRVAEGEYFTPELVGTDAMSAVNLAKGWLPAEGAAA
jgi:methanogenic corrinoid protein MtbC1